MKKGVNVNEEKAESLEINKRITKNVSENIHKVESIVSSARSTSLLFNLLAISARIKLRDACERAIFLSSSSASFIQRMEEILWRKVYYEPLSAAKKLRKGNTWTNVEEGFIWAHLNDGIAFYHHLLMTIAASMHNSVHCIADLLPYSHYDDDQKNKSVTSDHHTDSLFRSLTCLGDLARYMLDISSQISDNSTYLLSVRYYHQALHYNCEGGLTHSNLAMVYSSNNHPLLAAVHYLRAITCEKPFEAAESNLKRMLDKSRLWVENKKMGKGEENGSSKDGNLEEEGTHFLHVCLSLLSCFVNNRRMEEIAVLCQDVLLLLGKLLDDYDNLEPPDLSEASSETTCFAINLKGLNGCIDYQVKPPTSTTISQPITETTSSSSSSTEKTTANNTNFDGVDNSSHFLLTPESMVMLCSMFVLCIKRLKMEGSPHSNMSEVLLVSILLTLVSHINTRLEQKFALIDPTFVQKLLPSQEQNAPNAGGGTNESEKSDNPPDTALCNGSQQKKNNRGKRNKLAKIRRRRRNGPKGTTQPLDEDSEGEDGLEGDEDSVDSTNETEEGASSCDERGDDDDDNFDPSGLCSSEEDSDDDVKVEPEEEWEGMTNEEHLQLVEEEGMLAAVNIALKWLIDNKELIKMCGKTAHNLWTSLAKLFNLIRVDYEKLDITDSSSQKKDLINRLKELKRESFEEEDTLNTFIPALPENVMLNLVIPYYQRSLPLQSVKTSEVILLRLYCMNSIMFELCQREDTPLRLKNEHFIVCEEKAKVICEATKLESDKTSLVEGRTSLAPGASLPEGRGTSSASTPTPKTEEGSPARNPHTKGDEETTTLSVRSSSASSTPKRNLHSPISSRVASSMQSLTAQWLQHEVRNLEEKTNRRTKLGGLYVVPDASVLTHHLPVLKQMLATPSHMIIIPQVVIDALDQQKRDSLGARDAIRWLEVKLRHGSRFMRAQRPHEKAHLPLIKYPKRKDKEAWEWFHLAECCHYLGAQMAKSEPKTSTVTLLTSETSSLKLAKRSFSLHTLAEAAGAVFQSVDEFLRKWQISTKGHS